MGGNAQRRHRTGTTEGRRQTDGTEKSDELATL
jgi:hypothetical protein